VLTVYGQKIFSPALVKTARFKARLVELPAGATEDRVVVGTLDLEQALKKREK
jgi:Mg-chelatase subunit ChlI